jgi:hypothetical protein
MTHSWKNRQCSKTTAALLNALCSDMTQNDYRFFSQDTTRSKRTGRKSFGAGAAHWKKSVNLEKVDEKNANKHQWHYHCRTRPRERPRGNDHLLCELRKRTRMRATSAAAAMAELLKPAPTNKRGGGNSRSNTDPTRLSKTIVITKYRKTDHVLPLDAGMGLERLCQTDTVTTQCNRSCPQRQQ